MIILRGINLLPSKIEELILGIDGSLIAFPMRAGPPTPSRYANRAGGGPAGLHTRSMSSVAVTLTKHITDRIGVTVTVEVVEPNAVGRSEGRPSGPSTIAREIGDREIGCLLR